MPLDRGGTVCKQVRIVAIRNFAGKARNQVKTLLMTRTRYYRYVIAGCLAVAASAISATVANAWYSNYVHNAPVPYSPGAHVTVPAAGEQNDYDLMSTSGQLCCSQKMAVGLASLTSEVGAGYSEAWVAAYFSTNVTARCLTVSADVEITARNCWASNQFP